MWVFLFPLFFFFFFFFPYGCSYGIWKFPGQGLNLSHSCKLYHRCSNTRSFNPLCRAPGSNPCLCSDWSCWIQIPNLLHHSRNCNNSVFYKKYHQMYNSEQYKSFLVNPKTKLMSHSHRCVYWNAQCEKPWEHLWPKKLLKLLEHHNSDWNHMA